MKQILIIALILSSCSVIPRYNTEGVNLKQGGEISKDHVRCTLVSVKQGSRGFKHLFLSDKSDTLIRYYNVKMQVDSCYYIHN